MLGNFDRYGWVRGALKSFSEKRSHRAALPKGTRNYEWTLFRPDATALSELASLIEQQRLSLPIAIRKPLDQADEAFEHIRKGRPGRAIYAMMRSSAILDRYRVVRRGSPGPYSRAADLIRFRGANTS